VLSFGITSHPTTECSARQITDAFPWTEASRYLIRDRDAVYGQAVTRRDKPNSCRNMPASNDAAAERSGPDTSSARIGRARICARAPSNERPYRYRRSRGVLPLQLAPA
jgi:hypothetical protein